MVNYENPILTKNLVGEHVLDQLCQECSIYGKKAIIITQSNINPYLGLYARVLSLLNICGLEHITFQIKNDISSFNLALEATTLAKEKQVNMVLAIGVNDVMHIAKAVASGFYFNKGLSNFELYSKEDIKAALPILNVFTSENKEGENNASFILKNNLSETSDITINSSSILPKASFLDTFFIN
jgi:alcohol dehydrogenase YqhD (iron-dependent ADH family)